MNEALAISSKFGRTQYPLFGHRHPPSACQATSLLRPLWNRPLPSLPMIMGMRRCARCGEWTGAGPLPRASSTRRQTSGTRPSVAWRDTSGSALRVCLPGVLSRAIAACLIPLLANCGARRRAEGARCAAAVLHLRQARCAVHLWPFPGCMGVGRCVRSPPTLGTRTRFPQGSVSAALQVAAGASGHLKIARFRQGFSSRCIKFNGQPFSYSLTLTRAAEFNALPSGTHASS